MKGFWGSFECDATGFHHTGPQRDLLVDKGLSGLGVALLDLAAERGQYSTYKGSKWDRGLLPQDTVDLLAQERGMEIDVPRGGKMDWSALRAKIAKQGMRNSNVLAIAPTATISNIMGSSPCIEPLLSNMLVKANLSGDFMLLNPYLIRDLKKRGLWTADIQNKLKYMDGEIEAIDVVVRNAAKGAAFGWPVLRAE